MIPITRATLQSFCRICLQELPLNATAKEQNHDISMDSFRILVNLVTGLSMERSSISCWPRSICHSCFIKTNALKSFRDKAIIGTGVLKLLIAENLKETTLAELKSLCRICLKKRNVLLEKENNPQIYDWIYQCTGLRLTLEENNIENDVLSNELCFPQNFCSKCSETSLQFHLFRKIAKQSDDYLKSLVDGVTEQIYDNVTENIHCDEAEFVAEQCSLSISTQSGVDCGDISLDYEIPIEMNMETINAFDSSESNCLNSHEDSIESKFDIGSFSGIKESEVPMKFTKNRKSIRRKSSETKEDLYSQSQEVTAKHYSANGTKMKTKYTKRSFKCIECKKNFYKKYMFEAHMKIHEGIEKPFTCQFCPSAFRLIQVLNRHVRDQHNTVNSKGETKGDQELKETRILNICLYCQKQFKQKHHLKEHVRTVHEGLKPFKCSICEKAFGSKNTKLRHEQNHSKERPFVCEFCTKRYNSESELKVHIQRHITNPELLCPICKRGKPNEEELKQHIKMHESSRQHQCPKCGKVFTKFFHLREHDNIVHLKLRLFKCSQCDQSFGVRKTLKAHEESHFSTGRPEFCNMCKLYFKSRRALLLHTKKAHATGK